MSDGDDDGNSYSSDGESNASASYDDEHEDNSPGSPEMTGHNLRLHDEEEQHNRIQNWNSPRSRGNIVGISRQPRNGRAIASYASAPTAPNAAHASPRRGLGRTSYVSLVKQTEDEMELVRRRQGVRSRPGTTTTQLHGAEQRDKVKAKRRSANAVTLLFGRGQNVPHAAQIVQSTTTSQQQERRRYESSDTEVEFPLRQLASGDSEKAMSIRQAKTIENAAKRNTKVLKCEVGLAKLDVSEAKLTEFAATLDVRQAKIEERQAKLCRRRAALIKAEEDQATLESKMDGKEEDHRSRERRIRNRERRVKQEEAGLRLKEASLRKREQAVSRGIERIEKWRQIVDEKEEMQARMEEIIEKKEELHGRDIGNGGVFGTLGRKLRLKKSSKDNGGESLQPSSNQAYFPRQAQGVVENYPKPKARTMLRSSDRDKHAKHRNRDVTAKENVTQQKSNSLTNKNEVKGGALSLWL